MAYRSDEQSNATADAHEAIREAVESAQLARRAESKRVQRNTKVLRRSLALLLLAGVVVSIVGGVTNAEWFGLALTLTLILLGGVALMRLGGSLKPQAESEQASPGSYRSGL